MSDDRLPTATLVAELRTAADVAQAIADSVRIEEYRFQTRQEADLLRQAADRMEELDDAPSAKATCEHWVAAMLADPTNGTTRAGLASFLFSAMGGSIEEWLRQIDALCDRTVKEPTYE